MKTNSLRAILVTSDVTYIPENYHGLFQNVLGERRDLIVGAVFLKNLDVQTIKAVLGLRYLGAKNIQKQLLKNIFKLPICSRKKLLRKFKIPTASFVSMNDRDAITWCKNLEPDIIINARTRCIYRKKILSLPRLGCVNIHHGLLPEYRGTMCDLYALSESRPAGFTIHQMNKKIDDGLIFKKKVVCSGRSKNYLEYLQKGSKIEGLTLVHFLEEVEKTGQLPKGNLNQSKDIVFSKNPTRERVKEMKKAGMVL